MTTRPQSCGSCRWAEWWRTPTGRIKRGESGRCLYKIPIRDIPLPDSITKNLLFASSQLFNRNAIWPTDGESCPCYSPKQE